MRLVRILAICSLVFWWTLLPVDSASANSTIQGTVNEGGTLTLTPPQGYKIGEIEFASYGTPVNYQIGSCHASNSFAKVQQAISNNSLSINASNDVFGDPCSGVGKRLSVILTIEPLVIERFLAPPTNLQGQIDGSTATVSWSAPVEGNTPVERYAIFWSYDNWASGWAIASTTLSASISGIPEETQVQIKVRADNDSFSVYSDWSNEINLIASPSTAPSNQPTPQPEPTESPSPTPTEPTATPSPTPQPTSEPTPSSSPSPQPSPTPTAQPEPTPQPSPSTTEPTPSPSPTPSPESSPTPTAEPSANEASPSPTPNPTPTPTPTPTETTTPEPSPTPIPIPSPEPSPEPIPVPNPTDTPVVEPTPAPLPQPIPTPTPEPEPNPNPEVTPSPDPEPSPIPQPSEESQDEPFEIPTETDPISPIPEQPPSEVIPEPVEEQPTPQEELPPIEESSEPQTTSEIIDDVLTDGEITPEDAELVIDSLMQDGEITQDEVNNLSEMLSEDGKFTEAERELVAEALIESFEGEAVNLEAILEAGITLEDLPPATPVEVREDENGNAVIISAEVAVALQLLESPAEILSAIFESPAELLFALGNLGADMSEEEREEATKTIIAATIVGNIAVTASMTASVGSVGYRRKP